MDDIVARPRYSRRSVPIKRRKRNIRESGTFIENLMRQVVFALIILVLIGVIKSVNTPVTNFLSEKTKNLISQDIQIKEIYTKVNGFLDNIFNGSVMTEDGKNSSLGEDTLDSKMNEDTSSEADYSTEEDNSAAIEKQDNMEEQANIEVQDEDTMQMIDSIKEKYSFIVPVEGKVTSAFGERTHPVWKTEVFHSGVDIEAEKGVAIKSTLAGKVIEASNSATYGKYIKMEHENGIVTLYGHCSQLLVKKGQKVDKGKTIAKVGNTGVSVGTHLHFEIWKDGKPLDPLEFIKVPE